MNKIKVKLDEINTVECLNVLKCSFDKQDITLMSLELRSEIMVGCELELIVKSTNVSLMKKTTSKHSFSNEFESRIKNIEVGKLLSVIVLESNKIEFESIIPTTTYKNMNLAINDEINILINASDLSISRVL